MGCCSLTISVFAGPSYTWKHWKELSDLIAWFAKVWHLNNKNIFDEFCILFWINRFNCLLCLNMFKKGSVYFMLRRARNSKNRLKDLVKDYCRVLFEGKENIFINRSKLLSLVENAPACPVLVLFHLDKRLKHLSCTPLSAVTKSDRFFTFKTFYGGL